MKEQELWYSVVEHIVAEYDKAKSELDHNDCVKKIAEEMKNTNYSISFTGHDEAKEFYTKVMEYMNQLKGGKPFPIRYPSPHSKLILERKKDGATMDDIRDVLLKKSVWLKDEKMRSYFRPQTIFQKSKFDDYIGEEATGRTNTSGNTIDKFTSSLAAAQGKALGGSEGE